jgi:methyl-accepting chemotaxis protein
LDKLIAQWKNKVVHPMIALRRDVKSGKSMDDLGVLIGEERGKVYFDKIRKILSAFVGEEDRLSALRKAEKKPSSARPFGRHSSF